MSKLPIIESYWVEENRLLAGEYPASHNPEITRRRLDAFLEAGIAVFIDLTAPNELQPYNDMLEEQAKLYGVNVAHQRFSIGDYGVPSSDAMTKILDAIDKALSDGQRVYVHCWGGIGRTGTVIGCYLVRHGMPNEEALAHVNQLYKTRPADPLNPRSPQTDAQVEFVRNWWDDPNDLNRKLKCFCEG